MMNEVKARLVQDIIIVSQKYQDLFRGDARPPLARDIERLSTFEVPALQMRLKHIQGAYESLAKYAPKATEANDDGKIHHLIKVI